MSKLSAAGCEIREKPQDTTCIALCKESARVLKYDGISDKRLQELLNTPKGPHSVTGLEVRWLCLQVLRLNGYNIV